MRIFRAVLAFIALLLLTAPSLSAGKVVKPASSTATLECCKVFVREVEKPAKKIAVVADTSLAMATPTVPTTVRDYKTVDAPLGTGDRFVGVTVILSATDEMRKLSPSEWEGRRPADLAPDAELIFPDGVTVRAVKGAGFDGLESHVDLIAWGPGTVMTNEAREVVFRNYIWQPKDPFVGTETLYFPVLKEHWDRVKPEKLRIGQTELTFEVKGWKK